jgi:hypothetical protein
VPPLALSLSLSWPHLSQDGWTPLFSACYKGHVNVAEMLLSRGASVDHQNNVSAASRPVLVSLMASSLSGWSYSSLRCLLQGPCECGRDAVVERSLCRPPEQCECPPRPVPVAVSPMASSLSGWTDSPLLCLLQGPCECDRDAVVERSLCRPSEQCECRPSPCPCLCLSHGLISLRMDGLLSSGPAPMAM